MNTLGLPCVFSCSLCDSSGLEGSSNHSTIQRLRCTNCPCDVLRVSLYLLNRDTIEAFHFVQLKQRKQPKANSKYV